MCFTSKQTVLRLLPLFLFAVTLNAAEVTGKWEGAGELKFANGETRETSVYLDLRQDGQEVTGSAGPGPDRVLPISKGKLDGGKLTFEVVAPVESSGDGLVIFDFTVLGDKMEGTVKCARFAGKLSLRRS
jgi:hypothetical protein